MDEIKNEHTKSAEYSWRTKPLKFAPKSRLGYKTCKIRRVKCDLPRPSCFKCRSTGRTCDGYGQTPLPFKNEAPEIGSTCYRNEKADTIVSYGSYHSCTVINAYQPEPKQWHVCYRLILQNLGPFMILPVTGSGQAEAMCFFEYYSIRHLNEYRPCESWRETLILDAPNYLASHSSNSLSRQQTLKDSLPDRTPLLYYNRAIQLLLSQESGDSTEVTAITLLVRYLLICFDYLAGNDVQAMNHLRGGVELSCNIDKLILNNSTYGNDQPSETHTLICKAVTFLVDWTQVDIQEIFKVELPLSDSSFWPLDQAADHLQILVARVMRLCNTKQQISPMDKMAPLPSSFGDIVLVQLETWSRLFENILQQNSFYATNPKTSPLVSLLRLQHTVVWILLSSCAPGKEMESDNFMPQFQQCIALGGDVAAAHERHSGSSRLTFTPETGIVPVLYTIGVKCRHPMVRRDVLSILRRHPIREAVWDSISTARVIERVIEIEEDRSRDGHMIQCMTQIPVWQRIEALSWVLVSDEQPATRLDIMYTLCGQEGMHIEALMM
ncbi:Zn(II)2Cys6 transcription factor domain-containing protein [Aspergillus foveolatus]|uniref:Zn(II)2Cys6 transcription factor domain-containing protein n=1 Tax=Aspergillus foveolatus TaxID=210207 RepID=UPI003CCCB581